jgi:hypothetical protein
MSRREGVLRTDDDIVRLVIDPASPSAATRELERRLLICALEVRIEGGTRTWIVESWDRVAHREELAPLPLPALARERLASAVMAAIPASGVTQEPRLPWEGATGQS